MFLILPDILSADELADLAAGFDTAAFEDGRNTAAGAAQMVKKNRQISRQWPGIRHFENILDNALKRSTMLIQQLSPAACSPTIFAEYHPGDGYGCHTDTVMGGQPPIRHDISVTLFLNAPTLTPVESSGCIYRVGKFRMSNVKLAQPLPTQRPSYMKYCQSGVASVVSQFSGSSLSTETVKSVRSLLTYAKV